METDRLDPGKENETSADCRGCFPAVLLFYGMGGCYESI